ncbi:hypothetical protein Q6A25_13915 [Xanthomonas euvesicatoria pv. eucalypti]|uniref:hypothetical protein n=1 Tax=Xanthomonas euvesicatoria TaxID=456327 RepID=UPI0026E330D2|nr:hypothetical protein [Xanthomonas euvesicatoria]MDO7949950.1 hypothetical protein [Xanthomonas euvesicatoria pv. eucalypti]MDO7957399.1 hypothetical protein [Xanthomonas euvesicatoria pv. eucalypti]MDO7962077.1 hypothetical protein [Xanthomonas euvesicatoria pv. eucalypti]
MSSENLEAPQKSKGGRPPRVEGEKLKRVNLSLRPSLLYGLELLAKAQHRSLSQSMEWALQVGLNSFNVDNEGLTIGDMLAGISGDPHEPRNLFHVFMSAPTLLSFEDAMTCEAIWTFPDVSTLEGELARSLSPDEAHNELQKLYWEPAFARWEQIREEVVAVTSRGGKPSHVPVREILGVESKGPLLAAYQKAAAARSTAIR